VVFRRSLHPPADPAWPSARVHPPGHSKSNNFFKNFHERCIFRPLSPVLWVEESFFSLGERLVGSSRDVGRALRTHAHYMCVRLRRDRGDSSYKQHRRYSKLACKKLVKETSMRIDAGRENSERPTERQTDLRPPKW